MSVVVVADATLAQEAQPVTLLSGAMFRTANSPLADRSGWVSCRVPRELLARLPAGIDQMCRALMLKPFTSVYAQGELCRFACDAWWQAT